MIGRRPLLRSWAVLLLLLAGPHAQAQGDNGDVLLQTLGDWAQRSLDELRLEGSPPPQRSVLAAWSGETYSLTAEFGALIWQRHDYTRPGRVEVVVGDDQLNSSRFESSGSRNDVRAEVNLVTDPVRIAVERDLWLATDAAYKNAVAQLEAKRTSLGNTSDDRPPDWVPFEPQTHVVLEPAPPLPVDDLRHLALKASATFESIGGLDDGRVQIFSGDGHYYLATSTGSRIAQPDGYTVVNAYAATLRADGLLVDDRIYWVVRRPTDLPPLAEMIEAIRAMAETVKARAAAEPNDYYEGPVIFEGRAVAGFFRHLAPRELMGTPAIPKEDSSYIEQNRRGPRLGRRLLPEGWNITDDPRPGDEALVGGFAFDREGVAAQPVALVEDGFVRNLLMTQVPRQDLSGSNGHARGSVQGRWDARLSQWTVSPPRNLATRKFRRQVSKAMRAAGTDRVLVVRRLGRSQLGKLPRITDAVWLFADGHEETVLSLEFPNVDRRALRDVIAAAGGTQQISYLAPTNPNWTSTPYTTGLAMTVSTPSMILVEELEAVYPGPSGEPHSFPPPAR
jgi:predicted Zn-dependent protease